MAKSTSKPTTKREKDDLVEELDRDAANIGAHEKTARKPEGRPSPASHGPAEDFRQAVVNESAGDLNMDPREPYPTGNPPDPRESFHRIHGYYPEERGKAGRK